MKTFSFLLLYSIGVLPSAAEEPKQTIKVDYGEKIPLGENGLPIKGLPPIECPIIVLAKKEGGFSIVEPIKRFDTHLTFECPVDDRKIWASGYMVSPDSIPQILWSEKIDNRFFSLSYFTFWTTDIAITNIPENGNMLVVISSPCSKEKSISSAVLRVFDSDSQLGLRLSPGQYVLLVCKTVESGPRNLHNKFQILEHRKFTVNESDVGSGISKDDLMRINYANISISDLNKDDLGKVCPWIIKTENVNDYYKWNIQLCRDFGSIRNK